MRRVLLLGATMAGLALVSTPVPADTAAAGAAGDSTAPAAGTAGRVTGSTGAQAASPEAWAWTQLTDRGAEIRYVVTPSVTTCPTVTFSGMRPQSMTRNSGPSGTELPTTVCTQEVPAGATGATATINAPGGTTVRPTNKAPLPRWATRPTNIVVIGDTGCRVTSTGVTQDCTKTQDWPFQTVADKSAAANPDLVIHTGDYIYRASPQQRPVSNCNKDERTWGCLVEDFFKPAANLLAKAPIVFVRGNHELCARNGRLWFRYQANTVGTKGCEQTDSDNYTRPVSIMAGELQLLLFDSAFADDSTAGPNQQQVTQYTRQFSRVNSLALANPTGDNFLLTHKPLWTVTEFTAGHPTPVWVNQTLAAASAEAANSASSTLSQDIHLVLSGHVHLYQMLNFTPSPPPGAPHRPPQVTVGSSGTVLDDEVTDTGAVGTPLDTVPIEQIKTRRVWGYAQLSHSGGAWNLRYFDSGGTLVKGTNCTLNTQGTALTNCS